jgi:hypothetical protein
MHGGKSLSGYASPALKHGWYSKEFPFWVWRSQVEYQERIARRVAKRIAEHHAKR